MVVSVGCQESAALAPSCYMRLLVFAVVRAALGLAVSGRAQAANSWPAPAALCRHDNATGGLRRALVALFMALCVYMGI